MELNSPAAGAGSPSFPGRLFGLAFTVARQLHVGSGRRTSAAGLAGSAAIDQSGQRGAQCPGRVLAWGDVDRWGDLRKKNLRKVLPLTGALRDAARLC